LGDDGRLLYPEQVYSCLKKSGKTTFAAIHALTTTLLFGGRYPEATICANDFEQVRGRVFEMMKRIVECSPFLRTEATITQARIEFPALKGDFRLRRRGGQPVHRRIRRVVGVQYGAQPSPMG
jgi:phage terminase large subunit-like protein